jgi:hypothetical protein
MLKKVNRVHPESLRPVLFGMIVKRMNDANLGTFDMENHFCSGRGFGGGNQMYLLSVI